ncbi:putative ABC transporter ATP-binding protein YxlF [Novipirellula artificiosorum]|uniref:Putative ABC transporter ATP-binding protein YxlF n=1 Tax=Novipirellula artificiosorum TaxID=2528016 RepID=A0A5C6E0S6_9BACT|nr:putative ABC transporter ATP-binding protein YxlF [Novipirellula artificiosorum]
MLGPNGSGKSTLIKALLGLLKTQSGHGQVLGYAWPKQVRSIRDSVGFLPEDDCYIAGLVGVESVALMARLSGLSGTEGLRRAHEIMDFCDFGEERYREVESYSTGMRQKLKFAQSLVHDPPLLILDEPTTGLDPDQRAAMLSRIRTLASRHGKSVILSTHILPDVRAVCDNVIILVEGTVRVVDSLANLSRPVAPTIHIHTLGNHDDFVARIAAAGFAVSTESEGGIRVEGIDDREMPRLWGWAAETHTSIRGLEPALNSLDKIFMDVALGRSASTIESEPHAIREDADASQ